jgi:predicted nucleic acid-binding protein
VKDPVVADSTCLIALERIGFLEILPALLEPVLVPPEVDREFGVTFSWLKIETPANLALVGSLKLLVDNGEAEAIALASGRGIPVILDDRQARSVAVGLKLRVVGTLGCALRAKQIGAIMAVGPLIEKLESHGFYLGAALKSETLRLAGETAG